MTATGPVRRRRANRGAGGRLRGEILAAAAAILAETGSEDAVSIRAVADRVGVTTPSIYLHFADKDELLAAICMDVFSDFGEAIRRAGDGAPSPLDALHWQGRAYVEFALQRPEHYRLMFMRRPERPLPGLTPAEGVATGGLLHVAETVRLCQQAGTIGPGEPFEHALSLWAAAHGIASLLIAKPHFPWPDKNELVERVLDAIGFGVAAESHRGGRDRDETVAAVASALADRPARARPRAR